MKVFQGAYARHNQTYKKAAPTVRGVVDPNESKMVGSIAEVLKKCGIKDGMTLSFHHHFREGDYVVNMVMEEVHKMGIKDITICASSLGKAHNPIVPMIEDGTITGIQSSGVRGKIGEAKMCIRDSRGPVCQCAMYGGFGVLDEINMAKNEAVSVLHAVLDYRRVLDIPGYGKVPLAEETRFIGTMNYGYAGTRELNEALVSRFLVIDMPEPDEDTLAQIFLYLFPSVRTRCV